MNATTDRQPSRKRKWLRRLAILLGIVLVVRVGVSLALPSVVASVARDRGLDVTWEDLDISLSTGCVRLWHLDAAWASEEGEGASEEQPLAHLEYLLADVDLSALLTGSLRVHRVEVDGLEAHVERDEDGRWSFERLLTDTAAEEPEPEEEPEAEEEDEDEEPEPFELGLPIELRALRVQHVRLVVHDRLTAPDRPLELETSVRLTDLGHSERPARLRVLGHAPGLVDALRVDAHIESGGPFLDADFDIALAGLHPQYAAPWLEELGIRPVADALTMELASRLSVEPLTPLTEEDEGAHELKANLLVDGFTFDADGESTCSFESIQVDVPRIDHDGVRVEAILVNGVRAQAKRLSNGNLFVAGLEIGPPPATSTEEPEVPATEPEPAKAEPTPEAPSDSAPAQPSWSVGRVALQDAQVRFMDEAVQPATPLELELRELALVDIDPSKPNEPIRLNVDLGAAGLFEQLAVDGQLQPFAQDQTFSAGIAIEGLVPERAAPYLELGGLASTFTEGRLTAELAAELSTGANGLEVQADIGNIALFDGDELLALDRIGVSNMTLGDDGGVTVGAIEITGTRAKLARDADGALHVAGLMTVPAPPAVAAVAVVEPEPTGQAPAQGSVSEAEPAAAPNANDEAPRIVIDSVTWRETTIDWKDDALAEPVALSFADIQLTLEDLVLGGPIGGEAVPASLRLAVAQPGLTEEFVLGGTLTSRPGPLDVAVDLEVRGRGLEASAVRPYLEEAGVESQLNGAELTADIALTARADADALSVSAKVSNVALTSADRSWIQLDAVDVPSVTIEPDGHIVIDSVSIVAPTLELARDAEGALLACGLRIPPAPQSPSTDEPAAAASAPEPAGPADAQATQSSGLLELGELSLTDARIGWADAAMDPPIATALALTARVEDFAFPSDREARFDVRLGVGAALDELALTGTLRPDPDDLSLRADLDLRGLHPQPLLAYGPPGLSSTLTDGRASAAVTVDFGQATEGGLRAALALSDFEFRDAAQEGEPFLALERLNIDAPRIDAKSGQYRVADVSMAGLSLSAAQEADGSFAAMGFLIAPVEAPVEEASETSADEEQVAEVAVDEEPNSILDAPTAKRAASAGTRATTDVPTVQIDNLDIGVASARFIDRRVAGAEPLELSLNLALPEPTTILAPDVEGLAPLRLAIRGQATPIVETIAADVSITPWRAEPELELSFAVEGLSGEGLTNALPTLAETIDGSELDGGSFLFDAGVVVSWRRRHPLDFDLSNGLGLMADVKRCELRAREDGRVLAGVDSVHVDVKSLRPETGDIHIAAIEIERPVGFVQQSAAGLHVGGIILKTPEPVEGDAEGAEAPEETEPTEAESIAKEDGEAETDPTASQAGEVRLDRLTVSGLDFELLDTSVDPPLILPLDDLEIEVERFTTRALTEPLPIKFRASLYGGDIELPERKIGGSLVGGILSSAASAVTGADDEFETEERPIVDEVAVSGRMTLAPNLTGWLKLNVAALELSGLRGPALGAGVDIGDGLMNTDIEVRFRGEQGMTTEIDTRFEFLSLSEPPGGPVSSYLKLPAPLDTVLFVLRNEDGEQHIPLSIGIGPEGLSVSEVTSAATATLANVIADAIAASPFRIVGGVIDLAGFGPQEPVELTDQTSTVEFEPASTSAEAEAWAATSELCAMLCEDPEMVVVVQHEFGAGDLERIARIANPAKEDCLALGQRLRERKRELERSRHDLVAEVKARIALGRLEYADESAEQLRHVERDIGLIESALDRVYELVRPGAERGRERRTRAAARTIAELRLESIQRALEREGIPRLRLRLDMRRPRLGEPTRPNGSSVTLTPKRR